MDTEAAPVARAKEIEGYSTPTVLGSRLILHRPAFSFRYYAAPPYSVPILIALVEIARPFAPAHTIEHRYEPEQDMTDFELPLIAAGRFTTFATQGSLPALDWDL